MIADLVNIAANVIGKGKKSNSFANAQENSSRIQSNIMSNRVRPESLMHSPSTRAPQASGQIQTADTSGRYNRRGGTEQNGSDPLGIARNWDNLLRQYTGD